MACKSSGEIHMKQDSCSSPWEVCQFAFILFYKRTWNTQAPHPKPTSATQPAWGALMVTAVPAPPSAQHQVA